MIYELEKFIDLYLDGQWKVEFVEGNNSISLDPVVEVLFKSSWAPIQKLKGTLGLMWSRSFQLIMKKSSIFPVNFFLLFSCPDVLSCVLHLKDCIADSHNFQSPDLGVILNSCSTICILSLHCYLLCISLWMR